MRYYCIYLAVILSAMLVACKKEKDNSPENDPQKTQEPLEKTFFKDLRIDSIQQLSIVISYELADSKGKTGLLTALDSAALIDNVQDWMEQSAVLRDGRYHSKIKWPINLPPYGDIIWFRIYQIDEGGKKTYSQVFGQRIAKYEIRNKNVVNGRGADNAHPKDFFMNFEESEIGNYDNSLIVDAITDDVSIQHYKATINERPAILSRIDPGFPGTHKKLLFDVPDDVGLGPAVFKLYYEDRLVYQEVLNVVNGGFLTAVKHPESQSYYGNFFEYNGKLYTYLNVNSTKEQEFFYSWTPETNTWQKLQAPQELTQFVTSQTNLGAKAINGIFYFQPSNIVYGEGDDDQRPRTYEEIIISYNAATGKAGKIRLFKTTKKSEERSLLSLDYFTFNNKIYCISAEGNWKIHGLTSANQIRVFDPKDNSWTFLMSLPVQAGWKAVVNGNQVFLLKSARGKDEYATVGFVNEFYELDITEKRLVKKSWISDREVGVDNPYLTSFKNRIFVYGGKSFTGHTSLYSSLFAVYDPQKDDWSPVSGYSYFTGWVSQTDGFMIPVGSKFYLGLGIDRYTSGNVHGAKINNTIHEVSIK